jgi:5'-deoxynucleotidase
MSHFFAYLSRMKDIQRWGLMRNNITENIQEHSLQVAVVAHGLAVIRNRCFQGTVNAERVALLAMFHDASEVITGDLATPIKTFNPEIKAAYKRIEHVACERLFRMLPPELQPEYQSVFFAQPEEETLWQLIKAADKICAYLKCVEERRSGNPSFQKAEQTIRDQIAALDLPEVAYFMTHYAPSFALTLDELN